MIVSREDLKIDRDGSESDVVFSGVSLEKDKIPKITIVELATAEFHHKQVIIEY